MIKTTTQLDATSYLYNEGNKTERQEFEELLTSNEEIADEYFGLLKVKNELNKVQFSPSQKTLDLIMAYAIAAR